jgi:hypothetical protein
LSFPLLERLGPSLNVEAIGVFVSFPGAEIVEGGLELSLRSRGGGGKGVELNSEIRGRCMRRRDRIVEVIKSRIGGKEFRINMRDVGIA